MKTPRKTLGDWKQPEIKALMDLIETQSKITIANWCINYAMQEFLPIYEKEIPNDFRPRKTLEAAKDWLDRKLKLPEVKNIILNQCHAAARETNSSLAQAAARAIGQAASSIHVATHALGIAFYGAAAKAYNQAGPHANADTYDKIAKEEFINIYNSLKAVSIVDEPNPVKVKWHC